MHNNKTLQRIKYVVGITRNLGDSHKCKKNENEKSLNSKPGELQN